MKCIETKCNAFYVDPSSKKCILGNLQEPCLASQLPNDGITVYRNKDLQKLDCFDCIIENGIDYTGPCLNNVVTRQTDAASELDGEKQESESKYTYVRKTPNLPEGPPKRNDGGECFAPFDE